MQVSFSLSSQVVGYLRDFAPNFKKKVSWIDMFMRTCKLLEYIFL